ncbi:MAG: hypothetical protein QM594_04955 [Niabella sp.]
MNPILPCYSKTLLLFVLLATLSASCKKGNEPPGADGSRLRVKTVTNGNTTTSYSYDSEGRVVKAELDGGFYKETYSYEPVKVIHTIANADGTFTYLNETGSNGLVTLKQQQGGNTITYYEYDDKGHITRTYTNDIPVFETGYYYNPDNGLLDSMRSNKGGQWTATSVFLYADDQVNTISDENFGRLFYARTFPRPVKSVAIRRPDGNSVTVSITSYTYTFDNHKHITTRSFTTSGGQSGTETYTYY